MGFTIGVQFPLETVTLLPDTACWKNLDFTPLYDRRARQYIFPWLAAEAWSSLVILICCRG